MAMVALSARRPHSLALRTEWPGGRGTETEGARRGGKERRGDPPPRVGERRGAALRSGRSDLHDLHALGSRAPRPANTRLIKVAVAGWAIILARAEADDRRTPQLTRLAKVAAVADLRDDIKVGRHLGVRTVLRQHLGRAAADEVHAAAHDVWLALRTPDPEEAAAAVAARAGLVRARRAARWRWGGAREGAHGERARVPRSRRLHSRRFRRHCTDEVPTPPLATAARSSRREPGDGAIERMTRGGGRHDVRPYL